MRFVAPGLYPAIVGSTPTGRIFINKIYAYVAQRTEQRISNPPVRSSSLFICIFTLIAQLVRAYA